MGALNLKRKNTTRRHQQQQLCQACIGTPLMYVNTSHKVGHQFFSWIPTTKRKPKSFSSSYQKMIRPHKQQFCSIYGFCQEIWTHKKFIRHCIWKPCRSLARNASDMSFSMNSCRRKGTIWGTTFSYLYTIIIMTIKGWAEEKDKGKSWATIRNMFWQNSSQMDLLAKRQANFLL